MPDPLLAIETHGLVKRYSGRRALDGLDLGVPQGGVYALLGPNGAGKTTAVRVLSTLSSPDGGEARVLGHDVDREATQVRRSIALSGQYAALDGDLTGHENLTLIARLRGFRGRAARRRATDLLAAFELADAGRRAVRTYSGGMRRRLDLSASLVTTPQLLFLDEPTTGLDPQSRRQLWDGLKHLASSGTTILLTTQYLDEADHLANRIGLIAGGRLVAEGTTAELKASVGSSVLRVSVSDPAHLASAETLLADRVEFDAQPERTGRELAVRADDDLDAAEVIGRLHRAGIGLTSFSLDAPTLDEAFLALTARRPVSAIEDAA